MLICHCKAVSEREIRSLVRSGALTPAQVAHECSAGTECGGCARAVERIIAAERAPALARPEPLRSISVAAAAR